MKDTRSYRSLPATYTLIAMNVVWYLSMEAWRSASANAFLQSGALDRGTFHGFGVLRLLSSLFVHFSTTHLLVNMVSLWSMSVVERLFGSAFFIAVYGLSGMVGNVMSLLLVPFGVFGGASGAIFGLFGVVLLLSLRGVFTKSTRNQLLFWLAINIVFDFTQPNIGILAHAFGLLTGIIILWIVALRPVLVKRCRAVAWIVGGLTVLSFLVLI